MTPAQSFPAKRSDAAGERPLIVHLIYRLDYGGMETVLVDLINQMGDTPYRHAVICLAGYSDFRNRLRSPEVAVFDLNKRAGKDLASYARLWRLLRRLRPALVNTYNVATLDLAPVARLAGCRVVHAEHGWAVRQEQVPAKYVYLRRVMRPFVDRFVVVSRDLGAWLQRAVGVPEVKLACIHNGVDPEMAVRARAEARRRLGIPVDAYVMGTVARLDPVKAQGLLIQAMAESAIRDVPRAQRLYIVGEGPERPRLESLIREHNLGEQVQLIGARDDVPEWLSAFDVFVLPSFNEGISIAALEAMAAGLPVVAAQVGGNPEVVLSGITGQLVPVGDVPALAQALAHYRDDPETAIAHGRAGRERMRSEFSLAAMVERYRHLYDEIIDIRSGRRSRSVA